MNEERKLILEMLKEGTISVEEAERLLAAISTAPDPISFLQNAEFTKSSVPSPKRIVVLVTENDRQKMSFRMPFSLVRAGLKISKTVGTAFSKYVREKPEEATQESMHEMDFDALLLSINEGEITLPYTMVNADDREKNLRVQIIIE